MFRRRLCCCTTSCEDTSRPIAYVDKYATGAGDGTTWTDAYTTIQAAVTAHTSTHRIYIKGYGKADPYAEDVVTTFGYVSIIGSSDWDEIWATSFAVGAASCLTLLNAENPSGRGIVAGDNSVFIDCGAEDCGGAGLGPKIDTYSGEYLRCVAKNNTGEGFWGGGLFMECESEGNTSSGFSFYAPSECIDCVSTSNLVGFYINNPATLLRCDAIGNTFYGFTVRIGKSFGTPPPFAVALTDCSAIGNDSHGYTDQSADPGVVTVSECIADGNSMHGYYPSNRAAMYLTDCDASDNGECGYYDCYLVSGNTASGNGGACAGITYCDGTTDPCGVCDECP